MYNTKKQAKNERVWKKFLEDFKGMLAEAKDPVRRKELRQAIRDFKSLIAQGAALPQPRRIVKKRAA